MKDRIVISLLHREDACGFIASMKASNHGTSALCMIVRAAKPQSYIRLSTFRLMASSQLLLLFATSRKIMDSSLELVSGSKALGALKTKVSPALLAPQMWPVHH
jgi:hypothetical protein